MIQTQAAAVNSNRRPGECRVQTQAALPRRISSTSDAQAIPSRLTTPLPYQATYGNAQVSRRYEQEAEMCWPFPIRSGLSPSRLLHGEKQENRISPLFFNDLHEAGDALAVTGTLPAVSLSSATQRSSPKPPPL
ncbi:MAG: hypothetical protein ACM34A_01230, partial [Bacillota bacterium]